MQKEEPEETRYKAKGKEVHLFPAVHKLFFPLSYDV